MSPQLLDVYRAVDARAALPARINVMPLRRVDGVPEPVPLPQQHVSDMLRVDTVKFLADGGLSGATAALSVPYRHCRRRACCGSRTSELQELCGERARAGWRIATHAIGDVAIDQMLDIYEGLGEHPRGLSHRIEHFGLPDAAQLARAARLRVIAAPQTIFIHSLGPQLPLRICRTPTCRAPIRSVRCSMRGSELRSRRTRRSSRTTTRWSG